MKLRLLLAVSMPSIALGIAAAVWLIASAPGPALVGGDAPALPVRVMTVAGDVVYAASGQFYDEAVTSRILKPLGMNDASMGLAGIEASSRWAKPHVRARGQRARGGGAV